MPSSVAHKLDTSTPLSVELAGYKWLTILRELERAERRITKDIAKKGMLAELRQQMEAKLMEQ